MSSLCRQCGLFCDSDAERDKHVVLEHSPLAALLNVQLPSPPSPVSHNSLLFLLNRVLQTATAVQPQPAWPLSSSSPLDALRTSATTLPGLDGLVARLATNQHQQSENMAGATSYQQQQQQQATWTATTPLACSTDHQLRPLALVVTRKADDEPGINSASSSVNDAAAATTTSDEQANKPHVCGLCGKRFRLKQTLLVHRRTHTGEKPYQCPLCPLRFSHATNRKSHVRTHTKQRPFLCETCGRGFTRKFSLSLHRLRHLDSFPFQCGVCDKRFRRSDIYRTHMQGHSQNFRFACCHCTTRFPTKISLKAHVAKAHAALGVDA